MSGNENSGRPETTQEEKNIILHKLEPYLKTGLSVRKALLQAEIANSSFYDIMEKDPIFSEQIAVFQQFISIMLNSSVTSHLQSIVKKQNDKLDLTSDDIKFMEWFALNSNITKEEYGERKKVNFTDPEVEIQKVKKLLEENTTKEIKDN